MKKYIDLEAIFAPGAHPSFEDVVRATKMPEFWERLHQLEGEIRDRCRARLSSILHMPLTSICFPEISKRIPHLAATSASMIKSERKKYNGQEHFLAQQELLVLFVRNPASVIESISLIADGTVRTQAQYVLMILYTLQFGDERAHAVFDGTGWDTACIQPRSQFLVQPEMLEHSV